MNNTRLRFKSVSNGALWCVALVALGIAIAALIMSSWAVPKVNSLYGASATASTNAVQFVATGNGTSFYSYDGVTWTPVVANPINVGLCVGFAPELQQWLIGGVNGVSRSSDGTHFSLVTLPTVVTSVTAVGWSSQQRRWVIGSDVGMFYSADGVSWLATLNGPSGVTDITYNPRQSVWLAASSDIFYSPDGNNWTSINSHVFSVHAKSICSSWDSLLVLAFGAGAENSVAISQVGYKTFSGLGKPIFPSLPGDMSCAYGAGNMFVIGGQSAGTPVNIAYPNVTFGQVALTSGYLVATRYTVTTSGTLTSLSAFVVSPNPTGTLTMGVYSDTGTGAPGTLIATTPTQSLIGLGSRLVTLTPTVANVPISAPSVWIVHYFSALGDTIAANSSVSGISSLSYAYGSSTLPLTWPNSPAATTLPGTFHQFATIETQSNLAYTTDGGMTFNNIGASSAGTVNAVAYNPILGIWVLGGDNGFGNSFSGTQWGYIASGGVTINAIGVYYTPQISPSSKDGVVALSGVDPIAPNTQVYKFLFGGYGNGPLFRALGYTVDDENVFAVAPLTSISGTTGNIRVLLYTPETATWVMYYETTNTGVVGNNIVFGSTDPFLTGWVRVAQPSFSYNITSITWSPTQQIYLYTSNAISGPGTACWYSASPYALQVNIPMLQSSCQTVLDVSVTDSAYSRLQNLWVVVGRGSVYNMAYASDLSGAWTGFGSSNTTIASVSFIPFIPLWIFGDGTITADPRSVAVGQPAQPVLNTIRGCHYDTLHIQIVCVGSGTNDTIAYSSDGSAWTGVGNSIFTAQGNDICYNDNLWMAVGNGNSAQIASSPNGIDWTVISTNAFNGTRGGALRVYAPLKVEEL